MRATRRGILALGLAAAGATVTACSKGANNNAGGGGDKKVEVFTWWTGPGEQEGLDALVADFKKKNDGVEFINAAVAGGSGSTAKSVLANRLQTGNAPDSYQRHAGKELVDDIKAGFVDDLTYLYDREGWKKTFPAQLVSNLTIDNKIYSVPVNIHRSNLLWFNPKTLAAAGITAPPKTWAEFLTQAETLKGKGKIPLTIGPGWTQKHLLENVLLGELGTDKYNGLWTGSTDWKSAEVVAAVETYKKVLGYSNIKQAAGDWQPAIDPIISGDAGYNVMGDWADAYFGRNKKLKFKTDYDVVASPGSTGVYNFLADSFTLPKGAKNKGAAEKWLVECGSVSGQDAFNPQKGSVPARTDSDKSLYKDYLAVALKEWQDPSTKIVGSLTHGVVANNAFSAEIDTALGALVTGGDTAKFTDAVKKAYDANK